LFCPLNYTGSCLNSVGYVYPRLFHSGSETFLHNFSNHVHDWRCRNHRIQQRTDIKHLHLKSSYWYTRSKWCHFPPNWSREE